MKGRSQTGALVQPETNALMESVLGILERLVAFPSISSTSTTEVMTYIAAYFSELGARVQRLPSPHAGKENLWITFGEGSSGGIVLCGHIDVVPVADQDWKRPPFRLTRENGKVYGRGTTDMKGFVACVMATTALLDPGTLKRPVHIAITFDEEVGCTGAQELAAFLEDSEVRPAAFIVGEPTSMNVVDRHKGSVGFTTRITGKAVHSSQVHLGLSAIEIAAELARVLGLLADELRLEEPDPAFTYPYPSINVGAINGGTVRNIVAQTCSIDWEIRPILPEQSKKVAESFARHVARIREERGRQGGLVPEIETRLVYDTPPLVADPTSGATSIALAQARANRTFAASYGTEAGIYQKAGFSTVVCGPGDIQQAHTADEWIEISQLEECVAFLQRLLHKCT